MRLLAVVLLALAAGPQEERAPPGPGFTATLHPALGRGMFGEWIPYVLEIENRLGRDVDARIRLEVPANSTVVTRRAPLANGSKKRLFFYLPMGTAGSGYYRLAPRATVTDADDRILAKVQMPETGAFAMSDAFQLGLFSPDRASKSAFGLPEQIGSEELTVGRLTAPFFPDRWIGLACLDAVLLHDAPLGDLTPEQARALADYVRYGGTVILSPGADRSWLTHPVLAAFVPIRLGASEERDDLPSLTSTFGNFPNKRRFMYHRIENGEPIDARRMEEMIGFDSGFGRVIVLPFDLRRPPFDSWHRWEAVWNALLIRLPRRGQPRESGFLAPASLGPRNGLFNAMSARINTYPPMPLLIVLAALFLVAVGPVNYTILRKYRITLLNVVSVPALSVLFLTVVMATGYVLKGTSTVTFSARFLTTRDGLDCARERQLFTVFSPSTRTYRFSFDRGTFGLPLDRTAETVNLFGRSGGEGGPLEMEQNDLFAFTAVGVGQWQSFHVEAAALRDLGEGVSFRARGSTLEVTNLTGFPIPRGIYLRAGRGGFSSPFGEVPSGETREFPLEVTDYDPLGHLGFTPDALPGRMLGAMFRRLQSRYKTQRQARQEEGLICVLDEGTPRIEVDAFLSGRSEAVTLLHVGARRP